MYRDNASHWLPATFADHPARSILRASLLKICVQLFRTERVRALVDVDELRRSSDLRDRFCRCDERIRHGDDDFAGLYTGGGKREPQRVRAAIYGNTVLRFTEL